MRIPSGTKEQPHAPRKPAQNAKPFQEFRSVLAEKARTLTAADHLRELGPRPRAERPLEQLPERDARAPEGEREPFARTAQQSTPERDVPEPARVEGVRVPDGTQLAVATTDSGEVTARFVVPEGPMAGLDIYMRAEGRRLRVRADEQEGASYMRSICERLRHRGYDAEVED
jgi:hypothetical protein